MSSAFYERPMVKRLVEIFGDPPKPTRVVDGPRNSMAEDCPVQLDFASSEGWHPFQKDWHEATEDDLRSIHFHLREEIDLAPEYFDYVYPVALIRWRESQLLRQRGDGTRFNFYDATGNNDVLDEFLDVQRKQHVCDWVIDAYMEGVAAWEGKLSIDEYGSPFQNLMGPLTTFNSLGQTFPVTGEIMDRLELCENLGQAQWWLVFTTGVVYNADQGETIWAGEPRVSGKFAISINDSDAQFGAGYLDVNLNALTRRLTVDLLIAMMRKSVPMLLYTPDYLWAVETLAMIESQPDVIAKRILKLIECLGRQGLDGSSFTPLKD